MESEAPICRDARDQLVGKVTNQNGNARDWSIPAGLIGASVIVQTDEKLIVGNTSRKDLKIITKEGKISNYRGSFARAIESYI
jgi:hypothetical protein